MHDKTFKFAYSSSQLPLLLCKTKSKEFLALVDTGSEITIFDESLRDELYIVEDEKKEIVLHSMHGEEDDAKTVGGTRINMTDINEKEQTVTFVGILSDLSPISNFLKGTYNINHDVLVVIGSDTLNKEGAIIDCELGRIML